MCLHVLYYLAPLIPLLTRGLLCLTFRSEMSDVLDEEELDRESHRAHIMALAGFSFAALLALVVIDAALLHQNFQLPVYYLMVSFIFYMAALNLQGYKSRRWEDQVGTALMDAASLSLILSILSILFLNGFTPQFAWCISLLALSGWLIDHVIRLRLQSRFLASKKEEREND